MAKKTDPLVEALRNVTLFSTLDDKELRELAGIMKPQSFAAGEAVVKEGDQGGRFFVILEGTAEVTKGGEVRRELGAGDSFGEMSLIDNQPRSATVTAVTPLETQSMAMFNFRSVVQSQGKLAFKLLEALSMRLREVE